MKIETFNQAAKLRTKLARTNEYIETLKGVEFIKIITFPDFVGRLVKRGESSTPEVLIGKTKMAMIKIAQDYKNELLKEIEELN